MSVRSKRADGLGMGIMNYRASVLGAIFHIGNRPGGGTRITCDWTPATSKKKVTTNAS